MNNEQNDPNEIKDFFVLVRNRIFAGIFVVIPVGVTLWLGIIVFTTVTEWSKTLLESIAPNAVFMHWPFFIFFVRIFSLFVIVVFLFIVGEITKHTLGKKLIAYGERSMMKLPLLKNVYSTVNQIMSTIRTSRKGMFTQTVMFEYPRKGIYSIGFITNMDTTRKLCDKVGKDMFSVFLPTTPNPTSGFLLMIPKEDCILLNIDVGDAMKLIISGGAIQPPSLIPEDKNQTKEINTNGSH